MAVRLEYTKLERSMTVGELKTIVCRWKINQNDEQIFFESETEISLYSFSNKQPKKTSVEIVLN